jgi:signal peptidase I
MTQNDAEPRDSEHTVKCELVAQVLRSFGALRLEVTGLSMLPSVWPGDILLIERRDMREIAQGDIALFARHNRLVAHRVLYKMAVDDRALAITRGDGALSSDDPVSQTELLGRVRNIFRAGEYVKPDVDLRFRMRVTTEIIRRFGWGARILAFLHRLQGDRWRQETLCKS